MLDLETLDIETASVLLGRFARKQAAALQKQAQNDPTPPTPAPATGTSNYFAPLLGNTALYAGGGALGGAGIAAILTALQNKKKKDWLNNLLFGAVGGAGLGGAYGAFAGMPAAKPLAERAAPVPPELAALGLPDKPTVPEIEAALVKATPEQRAQLNAWANSAGLSVTEEPGAATEDTANTLGRAVRGGVIGGIGGSAIGSLSPLATSVYKRLPVSVKPEEIEAALKKNPQIANMIEQRAGLPAAREATRLYTSALADEDFKITNDAATAPDPKAYIAAAKRSPGYAGNVADLSKAKLEEARLAELAKERLDKFQGGRLHNSAGLGRFVGKNRYQILDPLGRNMSGQIGRTSDIQNLVNSTRQQILKSPRTPAAPAKTVWQRARGGGLAGMLLGATADAALGHMFGQPGS